jgi:hypothetical protein
MKARLRADLREREVRIPTLLPESGYVTEEDIDKSIYCGSPYDGLELLLLNNKLIVVYSIDLDVEKE